LLREAAAGVEYFVGSKVMDHLFDEVVVGSVRLRCVSRTALLGGTDVDGTGVREAICLRDEGKMPSIRAGGTPATRCARDRHERGYVRERRRQTPRPPGGMASIRAGETPATR